MKNMIISVDVERDLHGKSYLGITEGLVRLEKLCDKYKIKPVLFVTGECIEKYPKIFKKLARKGWEISFHGTSHERFDEMSYIGKENEIKKGISIWKNKLGLKPKGFRAPQHSIDNDTLDLLEKYGFEYDSSYFPLNLLQLIFFPKKIRLWFKGSFSRLNEYKIRSNLKEIPTSSFIIPFVSLTIRVFPKWLIYAYVNLIKMFYRKPVFYAHSWDFIELKKSRIDNMFSHKRFLSNLEYLFKISK